MSAATANLHSLRLHLGLPSVRGRVMEKMGANSLAELVTMFVRIGIREELQRLRLQPALILVAGIKCHQPVLQLLKQGDVPA
jgi:hypothetical protein